jgi:hypothetical protein
MIKLQQTTQIKLGAKRIAKLIRKQYNYQDDNFKNIIIKLTELMILRNYKG